MGRGILIPVIEVGCLPTSNPECRISGIVLLLWPLVELLPMLLMSLGALEEVLPNMYIDVYVLLVPPAPWRPRRLLLLLLLYRWYSIHTISTIPHHVLTNHAGSPSVCPWRASNWPCCANGDVPYLKIYIYSSSSPLLGLLLCRCQWLDNICRR